MKKISIVIQKYNKLENIENNILSIKDKSQYNYTINEYQAKELNISLLQEFPINNISDVYMYNYRSYLKEDLYDL